MLDIYSPYFITNNLNFNNINNNFKDAFKNVY